MKKLLCVILCIVFFHGCENKKEVENKIPDFYGFKTNINTTMNDVKISAKAEYESFGKLVLTFYFPESVNGMQIVFENGEYSIIYDDLLFSVSKDNVPYNMVAEIIRTCGENIKSATVKDNEHTFSSVNHIYKLITDETKGFKKITVDNTYIIEFEDFEYIMGHTE